MLKWKKVAHQELACLGHPGVPSRVCFSGFPDWSGRKVGYKLWPHVPDCRVLALSFLCKTQLHIALTNGKCMNPGPWGHSHVLVPAP
jgi:hypothetical protein